MVQKAEIDKRDRELLQPGRKDSPSRERCARYAQRVERVCADAEAELDPASLEFFYRVWPEVGRTMLIEMKQKLYASVGQHQSNPIEDLVAQAPDMSSNLFIKEGDYWSTIFYGKRSIIRHSQGMTYIAQLLASPDKDVPVLDFTYSSKGEGSVAIPNEGMPTPELEKQGLSDASLSNSGELLDSQAIREYRERVKELNVDISEAERNNDLGQIDNLKIQRNQLIKELARGIGLSGRHRMAGSVAERARVSVGQCIRRAISRIGKSDSELAQFLTKSIQTGITCKYMPDERIIWHFSQTNQL